MQDVRKTSARWRIGSIVGIVGLVAFVVLGVLAVVGMFMRSQVLVGVFPWALGAFAVAVIGMSVARTVKTPEDLEEQAALELDATTDANLAQASSPLSSPTQASGTQD